MSCDVSRGGDGRRHRFTQFLTSAKLILVAVLLAAATVASLLCAPVDQVAFPHVRTGETGGRQLIAPVAMKARPEFQCRDTKADKALAHDAPRAPRAGCTRRFKV